MRVLADEIRKFPRGRSDDQIDAMTQCVLWWQDREVVGKRPGAEAVKALNRRLFA
jgi:hypothetical protein